MLAFQHSLLTAAIGILLWAAREGWYWRKQAGSATAESSDDANRSPVATVLYATRRTD